MNQELTDFLQKKQTQSNAIGRIDWDARRDGYIKAVNELYQQIETILANPIARKTVALHRRPKTMTENYLGSYSVDDLVLQIGAEMIRFSPAGRNVAGSAGRVDVVGERGEAMLVVQADSRWGFVKARQPTLRVVPFDEAALAEVLQRVTRD